MPHDGDAWQKVLAGYSNFLCEKDLAPAPQRPLLVRWIREFLTFAQAYRGFTFEQALDLFLSEIDNRLGTKPKGVNGPKTSRLKHIQPCPLGSSRSEERRGG